MLTQDDKNKKAFDAATDARKLEIGLFWQRSLFFWGFIAAAFVAYGVLIKPGDAFWVDDADGNSLALAISCFGLLCSVAWALANRGSKYWQNAWEAKVERLEIPVTGTKLFSKIEPNKDGVWWGAWRYSVTRLTIALSDFTVLVWVFLAFNASPWHEALPRSCVPGSLIAGTLIYIAAMLRCCRTRLPPA